jgi:predicted nucleic acid-binding protein
MLQYLLDTNLLIYCFDTSEVTKQQRALDVLARVGREPRAALPAQVLAEFSNVTLRKLDPPLPPEEIYQQIELYEHTFPIIPLTLAIVLEAVRGVRDHGFPYYDAQIWAAARLSQIPVILSEDFPRGATVEGVTFLDPLEAAFDLDTL